MMADLMDLLSLVLDNKYEETSLKLFFPTKRMAELKSREFIREIMSS